MKNSVKNQDGIEETIRIYATDEMLDILIDKNYDQFFIDGTFKCVPKGIFLFKLKINPLTYQ